MKRLIKASKENDIIFEDEFFSLRKTSGVGMNKTPWTGLTVDSKDLAAKHVVEIRLNAKSNPNYDGEPVDNEYRDCYIAHGMRGKMDSLDETREYIDVLEDALRFADRVNAYIASRYE